MLEFGFSEWGSEDYSDDVDVWNMANINTIFVNLFDRAATDNERLTWMEYANGKGITEATQLYPEIVNVAPTQEDRITALSRGFNPKPVDLHNWDVTTNRYWYYGYPNKELYDAAIVNATRLATIIGYYLEVYEEVKSADDQGILYWSEEQVKKHLSDTGVRQEIVNGAGTLAQAIIAFENGFRPIPADTVFGQWYYGFPGKEYYLQYTNPFEVPFQGPLNRDWVVPNGYAVTFDPALKKPPGEANQTYEVTATVTHIISEKTKTYTFNETSVVTPETAELNAKKLIVRSIYKAVYNNTTPDAAGVGYWASEVYRDEQNVIVSENKWIEIVTQSIVNGAGTVAEAIIAYERNYRPSPTNATYYELIGDPPVTVAVWYKGYPGQDYYIANVDLFKDIKITSRTFLTPKEFEAPVFIPAQMNGATGVRQTYQVTATIKHLESALVSKPYVFTESVPADPVLEAELQLRQTILDLYLSIYDRAANTVTDAEITWWASSYVLSNWGATDLMQALVNGADTITTATIAYNNGYRPDRDTLIWYKGYPSKAMYLAEYDVDTDTALRNLVPGWTHNLSSEYSVTYSPKAIPLATAQTTVYNVIMTVLHIDSNKSKVFTFIETVPGDPSLSRREVALSLVPNIYTTLLNRDADTPGLNYWVNEYSVNTYWTEALLRQAFTDGAILADRMYIFYHGARPSKPTTGGWVNNYPHAMYASSIKSNLGPDITYTFCITEGFYLVAGTVPTAEDITTYTAKLDGTVSTWSMATLLVELGKAL